MCTRVYVAVCGLVCGRDRPGAREAGGGSQALLEVEEGPGGKGTVVSGLLGDKRTHLPGEHGPEFRPRDCRATRVRVVTFPGGRGKPIRGMTACV